MKILGFEFRKIEKVVPELRSAFQTYDPLYGGLSYSSYSSYAASKALTLSACYRAVNLISDAISSLQMKVYQIDTEGYKTEYLSHPLYNILGIEPNSSMSRFTFFKLIISSILLRGNAYIKIYRDSRFNVTSLEFLNPDTITMIYVKGEEKYIQSGAKGYINSSDMIHILNFPQLNNSLGLSTIAYVANSLEISYNSDTHAGNYFQGGANMNTLLSFENTLSPKQQKDIIDSIKNQTNATNGTSNGISTISGVLNAKVLPLSISPKDSQLLETRAFNVLDIARFFSVNPILLFDNSKATFSNVENAQLDFLNTTLLPIIEKIENEFLRKLIRPSQRSTIELRFDLSNILRADMNSKADYYTKLFNLGVLSSNQVAKELNLPKIDSDGANKHFISTNLQDSDNLIVNSSNSVDNKLKQGTPDTESEQEDTTEDTTTDTTDTTTNQNNDTTNEDTMS